MRDEIRRLRAAVARRDSGPGKRFTPEIRRRISDLGRRLRADGASWRGIGDELGLSVATVQAEARVIALPRTVRVFAYGKPTDLRKGYNGLVGIVQKDLGRDPLGGDLFLFVSRAPTTFISLASKDVAPATGLVSELLGSHARELSLERAILRLLGGLA